MEPLWKTLRPQTLNEFLGNEQEISELANVTEGAAVLFCGPIGCGKTALALALAEKIAGRPLSGYEDETAAHPVKVVVIAPEAKTMKRESIAICQYVGRRILFIDEAHEMPKRVANALRAWMGFQGGPDIKNTFLLCTAEPEKLDKAIFSRCLKVRLGGLEPSARVELVERAWAALGKSDPPPPALILTIHKLSLDVPRDILNAVQEVASGTPVLEAVTKARLCKKKLTPVTVQGSLSWE